MSKPSAANTRQPGSTRMMVERPTDDDYPSPPAAVRALLANEKFPPKVWDMFCGAGVLLAVVRDEGHGPVVGTTLHDYGDQFELGIVHSHDATRFTFPPSGVRAIVSNPAYGILKENDGALMNKILDLGCEKVALLMDTSFLEGQKRHEMVIGKRPPARVYHFVDRVTMIPHRLWEGRGDPDFESGGATAFSWIVWEKGYTGPGYHGHWLRAADYARHDDLDRYQVNNRVAAQARRLL